MPGSAATLPRASIGVNAALAALLLWLYAGDISDVLRARATELAAMSALPSLPFAVVCLAGTLLGVALTALGVLKRRDGTWRGYRVMPIVAVVALFVDLFVLSASKTPFSSNARAVAALDIFEQRAAQLATPTSVPADEAALDPVVKGLGGVPWLVKGEGVADWTLKIFNDCQGPRLDSQGVPAGTVLYCVNGPRTQAWVTLVGLPQEQRFGASQLVTQGGAPLLGQVHTSPVGDNEVPPRFTGEPDASTLSAP